MSITTDKKEEFISEKAEATEIVDKFLNLHKHYNPHT